MKVLQATLAAYPYHSPIDATVSSIENAAYFIQVDMVAQEGIPNIVVWLSWAV
jgi:hypothetical protein